MQYALLAVTTCCLSLQNIMKKQYNTKSAVRSGFLFSGVTTTFSALLFFLTSGFKLHFTLAILPYSVAFALSFSSSIAGSFFAIKYGSLSLTQLFTSYSLLIPTFYGIFFLNERLKPIAIVGFVLVLVSVLLISGRKGEIKITGKVALFLLLGFVGNGMCSTVQKIEQLKFDGGYKSEFMIVALLMCTVFFFAAAFITEKPKLNGKELKALLPFGAISGICNGSVNYLVMVLTSMMSTSLLFPSISAGGIAIGFVVSIFVYKERLTAKQCVGYFLGTVSVVLLNL